MINVRRSGERGRTKIDWLDSYHTFSFGEYYDPAHMSFHSLRVINDDRIAAGSGFGSHSHRDMEILTYVLDGVLEHKDNLGNGSLIRPGDIQRMSAGTGIVHSEFNHSKTEPAHFLQIWILPERKGLAPGYEQRTLTLEQKQNRFCLIASPNGIEGSVRVQQAVHVSAAILDGNNELIRETGGNAAWIQVARGSVTLNEVILNAGDGASVEGNETLRFHANGKSEILLFELNAKY